MTDQKPYEPSGHALRAYDIHHKFHATMLSGAIDAGKEALKAALILNGGACLALLSFLAVVSTSEEAGEYASSFIPLTLNTLLYFSSGALLSAIGSGCAFASYTFGSNGLADKDLRDEYPFTFPTTKSKVYESMSLLFASLCMISVIASYVLFGLAVYAFGVGVHTT